MNAPNLQLWYNQPAGQWSEALPIGNGRLGAMVFGGVGEEWLRLDEITCWSGAPSDQHDQPGADLLPEIRRALIAEDYAGAERLSERILGRKLNFGTHLPLGNLRVSFGHSAADVQDYRRELDLETAVASVSYREGNVTFRREVFAAHPSQLIVLRIAADRSAAVNFALAVDGANNPHHATVDRSHDLVLTGQARETKHSDGKCGVDFQARLRVLSEGGRITIDGARLRVDGANAAVILVAAATNFDGGDPAAACRAQIEAAAGKGWDALRADHIADHRRLFGRVTLDLGTSPNAPLPTGQRLAALENGAIDPALDALMFQYGRYLLIAASREDSPLPMHLQGLWNDNKACNMGWTCDMHLDINIEMNYWPAEVGNLPECHEPLFRWIESRLAPAGRRTAEVTYGCKGWVTHVFSNAWGYTAPGWSTWWGLHVTGGVWIASDLWEHFRFTGDRHFLAARAYPVLREAAEFFLEYLMEDPATGCLVTGPSCSPENAFLFKGGRHTLGLGPTCDNTLLRELFGACLMASEILGTDETLRLRWKTALARLPSFRIGKQGQLQEWRKDYDEPFPNHRHTSHLLALYPFHQITRRGAPELAKAAQATIARRLNAEGWEDIEWSRANMICFYACLGEAEAAHASVRSLITKLAFPNLLTFSPSGIAGAEDAIFIIDGNTGATAGIAEMLLQSHAEPASVDSGNARTVIELLPALPKAWSTGYVKGLCARGGFDVDMFWRDGQLCNAILHSKQEQSVQIRYGDQTTELQTQPGQSCHLDARLGGK